jgi:Tetratricopeptide repeat
MDPASKRALSPRLCAALVALALGVAAPQVHAQPTGQDPLTVAQSLHEQAVKALDAKDYATACPKFEEVVRLVPNGLGARLSLAECYEGAGRLASAFTTYVALEEAAAKDPKQRERQTIAQTRAQALEPRLARLTIVVPDAVRALPGLEIQRDGAVVPSAQWGAPLPVDKGAHVLTASATGKQRLEKAVNVPSDGTKASVTFDKLDDLSSAPGGAPPGVEAVPPVESTPPDEGTTFFNTQRTAGLAVGGVGVIGVVVGAIFGAQAISKLNESNEGHCNADTNKCDPEGLALREDGHTAGTVSTVMFVLGGLAVAGGVTLFVTAPSSSATSAKVAVGPGGITLRGTW